MRTRASLFGNNAPLFQPRNANGTPNGDPQEWTLIRSGKNATEARRFRVNVTYSSSGGEFPEPQGVMGRHYAIAFGKSAAIANAIDEHWWPKGQGGALR